MVTVFTSHFSSQKCESLIFTSIARFSEGGNLITYFTFFHVLHILSCSFVFFYLNPCMYCCMFCILLFNFVNCIYFLLCLCIVIVMYVLFCIFCFHRANWHSSAFLTVVFPCFFLSCKANAKV